MTPDISEFSYGFALTQELIALPGTTLSAAPVFPSLIEEGRAGGGYDVKLDIPGFPLFIQFKRSDCMVGKNAKEVAAPYNFIPPFYRMKITERSRSAQHDMLVDLDNGHNQVFYAAPLFHRVEELNDAYLSRTVSQRSFYIRPNAIGHLDDDSHHVAFDHRRYWVFSEPREVKGIRGEEFPTILKSRQKEDVRPLRDGPIKGALDQIKAIVNKHVEFPTTQDESPDVTGLIAVSETPDDGEIIQQLRRLADVALLYFGAQLFIVQDSLSSDDTQ